MTIPDLPLFKHRDTVVTPADQNQFVTQFETTMDTMSNSVIPAINDAITDINSKVVTSTTARDEAEDARDIAVAAKDEAVTAVATLQSGAIDDTTIASNKAFSNQKTNQLLDLKLDKDFSSLTNKSTLDDTDNFAIQEVVGDLKKVSYKNLFDKVSITGNATFNGATQTIDLTNIGNITLAIGDVIEVSGTTSNNKLFTVESIPSANQIIVNYEHRGTSTPPTSKRLINETANATVKLYNRAKDAPDGQGQDWVYVTDRRTIGVENTNNTGRALAIKAHSSAPASATSNYAYITLPSPFSANLIGMSALAPGYTTEVEASITISVGGKYTYSAMTYKTYIMERR